MNVKLRHTILFNRIIIIEYIDKVVVGFLCDKENYEKIKDELEKFGKVYVEDFGLVCAVEVHTTKELVPKILRILKEIPLLEIGYESSNLKF